MTGDGADSSILEMKKKGGKVLGYYCCYLPVELLTAAGIVPYRITGNPREQVLEADSVLESVMCPWARNTLDQALKGRYSFLDGIIVPHVCDAVQRMYGFWKHYIKLPCSFYFEIPHIFSASAFRFFTQELAGFKRSLEEFIGRTISDEELERAIAIHNENRRLVQELYSLRKTDPPPVSAAEVLRLLKAGMRLPVAEFNRMLGEAIAEARKRPLPRGEARPRIAISGCVIDDEEFCSLVADCGARIVMDDLPVGTRSFWFQVGSGASPLAALARAYLAGVRCPRTIEGKKTKPYKEELRDRFGYLVDYAREFRVDGFILNLLRFCDCHEFDFPDLKEYLPGAGFPTLVLDDDYTLGSRLRVKTRVEAFIETLEWRRGSS